MMIEPQQKLYAGLFRGEAESIEQGVLRGRFLADPGAELFGVHFPDFPVVPGSAILSLVLESSCSLVAAHRQDFSVTRMTFVRPLTPGVWFPLELRCSGGSEILFVVGSDRATYSRGRLRQVGESHA